MNLILFGFKNCGKSYFGKLLAEELQLSYVDTDLLIERQSGMSCSHLYQTVGSEEFRKIESEAILSLDPLSHTIISVGGGAVLEVKNVSFLKTIGLLVYLEADRELLKKRMLNQPSPPAYMKEVSFEEMYESRLPIYEKIEAARVNIAGNVIEELKELYYGK